MTKISATMLKALRAVARGDVYRLYRRHGNVFPQAGTTSPATLWKAEEAGLILDGETISSSPFETVVRMKLTAAGREALT